MVDPVVLPFALDVHGKALKCTVACIMNKIVARVSS